MAIDSSADLDRLHLPISLSYVYDTANIGQAAPTEAQAIIENLARGIEGVTL